jgi:hypothetical protein
MAYSGIGVVVMKDIEYCECKTKNGRSILQLGAAIVGMAFFDLFYYPSKHSQLKWQNLKG